MRNEECWFFYFWTYEFVFMYIHLYLLIYKSAIIFSSILSAVILLMHHRYSLPDISEYFLLKVCSSTIGERITQPYRTLQQNDTTLVMYPVVCEVAKGTLWGWVRNTLVDYSHVCRYPLATMITYHQAQRTFNAIQPF